MISPVLTGKHSELKPSQSLQTDFYYSLRQLSVTIITLIILSLWMLRWKNGGIHYFTTRLKAVLWQDMTDVIWHGVGHLEGLFVIPTHVSLLLNIHFFSFLFSLF